MSGNIRYSKVSGADIERLVRKLQDVLDGEEKTHIMMACLVIAIGMQKPDIKLEQMVEGVKGASEWISMFVSETDITEPGSMN